MTKLDRRALLVATSAGILLLAFAIGERGEMPAASSSDAATTFPATRGADDPFLARVADSHQREREVDGIEDTGALARAEIRVGGPKDSVPFLGTGVAHIAMLPSSRQVSLPVLDGRIRVGVPEGGYAEVQSLDLQGPGVAFLKGDPLLSAGTTVPLYVGWIDATVVLTVQDAESEKPLANVDLWRVAGAGSRLHDPFLTGDLGVGPRHPDFLLRSGLKSPFVVDIPDDDTPQYWITRMGYVPFRFRFPVGMPSSRATISLRRSGSLRVYLESESVDLDTHLVRVYPILGVGDIPEQDPVLEAIAQEDVIFPTIPPGTYAVMLERRHSSTESGMAMATAVTRIDSGEERQLLLRPILSPDSPTSGRITVAFPNKRVRSGGQLYATIHSLSPRVGRGVGTQPVFPGSDLGPISLPVGDYSIELAPDNVSFFFRVSSGEDKTLRIPSYRILDSYVTVINEGTQETLAPTTVAWSAPMTWLGEPDLQHPVASRTIRVDSSPFVLPLPVTKILFTVHVSGMGIQETEADLRMQRDPVLLIAPVAELRVVLDGLDDAITLPWLQDILLYRDGRVVEMESTSIHVTNGVAVGEVFFLGSGELEVHLPPLASYGNLVPQTVFVDPGTPCTISLGPASVQY